MGWMELMLQSICILIGSTITDDLDDQREGMRRERNYKRNLISDKTIKTLFNDRMDQTFFDQ